jgi:hypothetical protein
VTAAHLEKVNRLRAELGLAPLKAQQIAHDGSLAEHKAQPVVDRFDRELGEGRR